tara:strand:- start:465 stop:665 length:201 start_codon:yes stop_codon:yes gene_type:complete
MSNIEQSKNPYYCNCKACINRAKEICPTKLDLLIENLENEIENKKKELEYMKEKRYIMRCIANEYR